MDIDGIKFRREVRSFITVSAGIEQKLRASENRVLR